MGKIGSSTIEDVRVKVTKGGGGGKCAAEVVRYLACLDANGGDDTACKAPREALAKCMAAPRAGKLVSNHKAPINYHLRKFLNTVKR